MLLWEECLDHLYVQDFCITVQYDGFIIDPNWTDEFLDYDYIGFWANEPNNLVGKWLLFT